MSDSTASPMTASISEDDGQISRRNTGDPSVPVPNGSFNRSMSMVPASA